MITRKCVQCHKIFTLTDKEIEFYKSRNLELPKRCKECRAKNNMSVHKSSGFPKALIVALTVLAVVILFAFKPVSEFLYQQNTGIEVTDSDTENQEYTTAISEFTDSDTENQENTTTISETADSDTENQEYTTTICETTENSIINYTFRNTNAREEHYQKHGIEMGFSSSGDYELSANRVANSAEAIHKTEKEDGDDIYYLESTNELVIISTDGYIRTYFCPEDGKQYYDRQ